MKHYQRGHCTHTEVAGVIGVEWCVCGHVWQLGTRHDCICPVCPASTADDRRNVLWNSLLEGAAMRWINTLPVKPYNEGTVREREEDIIISRRPGTMTHLSYRLLTGKRVRTSGRSLFEAAQHLSMELRRRHHPMPPTYLYELQQQVWNIFQAVRRDVESPS
ncbi:MAG TPA: hypothetical protein VF761_17035 [Gemmatimonadaceae bacterium]